MHGRLKARETAGRLCVFPPARVLVAVSMHVIAQHVLDTFLPQTIMHAYAWERLSMKDLLFFFWSGRSMKDLGMEELVGGVGYEPPSM